MFTQTVRSSPGGTRRRVWKPQTSRQMTFLLKRLSTICGENVKHITVSESWYLRGFPRSDSPWMWLLKARDVGQTSVASFITATTTYKHARLPHWRNCFLWKCQLWKRHIQTQENHRISLMGLFCKGTCLFQKALVYVSSDLNQTSCAAPELKWERVSHHLQIVMAWNESNESETSSFHVWSDNTGWHRNSLYILLPSHLQSTNVRHQKPTSLYYRCFEFELSHKADNFYI